MTRILFFLTCLTALLIALAALVVRYGLAGERKVFVFAGVYSIMCAALIRARD